MKQFQLFMIVLVNITILIGINCSYQDRLSDSIGDKPGEVGETVSMDPNKLVQISLSTSRSNNMRMNRGEYSTDGVDTLSLLSMAYSMRHARIITKISLPNERYKVKVTMPQGKESLTTAENS